MKDTNIQKTIIISTIVVVAFIIFMANKDKAPKVTTFDNTQSVSQNVNSTDGKQVIDITAKGGYAPRMTVAKANVPTILRVKTNATFDCSSSLRIPTLNYSQNLPPTGTTDIEVPAQVAGTTLKALCSMGMYNFTIAFSS